MTPGGLPQSLLAMPYYRDDSCFDDGTGSDPGPRVNPGSSNEPRTYVDPATGAHRAAEVLDPGGRDPGSRATREYYQGDIGTHGLHLLFQLDSDNARQEVPIDEIVSEQRIVLLPGQQANVGEDVRARVREAAGGAGAGRRRERGPARRLARFEHHDRDLPGG